MKNFALVFLFTGLIFVSACQRTTNELPVTNILFTKTAYTALNDAKLDAYFTEHVKAQPYTLSVHFLAKPGVTLTQPNILIESYTGTPSFNTVNFPTPISLASLNSTYISAESQVNINPPFPIDTSKISVLLLSDSSYGSLAYSGYYTGLVIDTFINDSVGQYPAKGFIDAGGNTYLLIQDNDLLVVTGILIDSASFLSGKASLPSATAVTDNLGYAVKYYSSTAHKLQFQLSTSAPLPLVSDSAIKTLSFVLNR